MSSRNLARLCSLASLGVLNVRDPFNLQVKSYKSGALLSTLFRFKDWLIGNDLTEKRADLAKEFEEKLTGFKISLASDSITPKGLEKKVNELEALIQTYQDKNTELSKKYNKTPQSGRLATKLGLFKEQLDMLKEGGINVEEKSVDSLRASS